MLLADLLDALGVRHDRLRLSSLGTPETRAEYREELKAYLRAHEGELAGGGPRPDRPEPDARVRLRATAGTREVMRDAPKLLDRLTDDDAEHFAQVRALLDDAGLPLRDRPDARPRNGLLHPDRVRVHQRRPRRAVRRRRRRPLRRPDRAARRTAHAGMRLGGGGRADAAGRARPAPPAPSWSTCSSRWPTPTAAARRVRAGPRGAPGRPPGPARARRALAQGPAQARRSASARGTSRSSGSNGQASLRDMAVGEQREHRARSVIPTILRGPAGCEARAAPQRLPRRLVRPADRRAGRTPRHAWPAGCTAAATTAG